MACHQRASDGRCREFGGAYLWGVYRPGEWLWIDSNGKNENRHPVEGSFGNEFPSICNHCGVMAAWSGKTLEKILIFFAFLVKRLLTEKLSKFYSESFHRDTDRRVVYKFCEIWPPENRKSRALFTDKKNKISFDSPALTIVRIAPKICRVSLRQRAQITPDFIQIGSLSAELYPNEWTPSKWAAKCFQYSAEAYSFEPNN